MLANIELSYVSKDDFFGVPLEYFVECSRSFFNNRTIARLVNRLALSHGLRLLVIRSAAPDEVSQFYSFFRLSFEIIDMATDRITIPGIGEILF